MWYVLVSPILPGNIASLQLQRLQSRFKQAQADVVTEFLPEDWTASPDWQRLHNRMPDNDYEKPFYRLLDFQPRRSRRLVFDIRRYQGQFPLRTCKFLQYAATATSHVSAFVTAEDEQLVTRMFPFKETIPDLFTSPEQFLQREQTHMAS